MPEKCHHGFASEHCPLCVEERKGESSYLRMKRRAEQAEQTRDKLAEALRRIERDDEYGSDEQARIWMRSVAQAARINAETPTQAGRTEEEKHD